MAGCCAECGIDLAQATGTSDASCIGCRWSEVQILSPHPVFSPLQGHSDYLLPGFAFPETTATAACHTGFMYRNPQTGIAAISRMAPMTKTTM
jgi:hypothetical protein